MRDKTERNAELVRLRDEGLSYTKLALIYGITTTRVREIYHRAKGLPLVSEAAQARAAQRWEWQQQQRQQQAEMERVLREARRKEAWLDELRTRVLALSPSHWDLQPFALWLLGRHDNNPLGPEARAILDAWRDGRANETATVMRLRRLLSTWAMPEGLAA